MRERKATFRGAVRQAVRRLAARGEVFAAELACMDYFHCDLETFRKRDARRGR